MPGATEFTFSFARHQPKPAVKRRLAGPMRILVLGDFSGRSLQASIEGGDGLAGRSIMAVDVDNFETVMSRVAPQIHFPAGGVSTPEMVMDFRQMDHFHPEKLYRKLAAFQELSQLRDRLQNPATFEEAAEELRRSVTTLPPGHLTGKRRTARSELVEDDAATLERLLGKRPVGGTEKPGTGPKADVSEFIKQIVGEHTVPEMPPYKDIYIQSVDQAISAQMRKLLHHPAFQALEAAWRSVEMLVTGLETGENLSLHLLDVTKEELRADMMAAAADLASSHLYRLLQQTSDAFDGQSWSVLAGNYTFGTSAEDVSLLAALGVLASHVGGPFLAAADSKVLGCRSLSRTPDPSDWAGIDQEAARRWLALRRSPAAQWVGLALPRVLMRLPFGHKTEPVDLFEFEEMPPDEAHDALLWGNPAFHCALLIARSFLEQGWSMQPGDLLTIDELPAYVFEEGGESRLQPCAEVCLGERAMEAILARGVMPLMSARNRNCVHLARFQSVAEPPTALAGPWN